MNLIVNGIRYSGWTSADATVRLDKLTNAFSFQATSKNAIRVPFGLGDECEVTVAGKTILTGFIEIIDVSGTEDDHTISVSGRDRTGDLVDSSIDKLGDIAPPITLQRIVEAVVRHVGLDLKVVDELSPSKFETLSAPEPGDNAWGFIEKLARRKQAVLTSNADGDVVISSARGTAIDAAIKHVAGSDENNVLKYSGSFDATGRYNLYKVRSQGNPVDIAFGGSGQTSVAKNLTEQENSAVDDFIRRGRQWVLVSESNSEGGSDDKTRAEWQRNVDRARGRMYSATVHGFTNQTDDVWRVNTLVNVDDEFAAIRDQMLVNSIQFSLDSDGGRSTALGLMEKDAYTLEVSQPLKAEKTKDAGIIFSPE